MKMKPFNKKKTPINKDLLVYFSDWGYRIAQYSKLGDMWVWKLQGGDWHPLENTYWCELPTITS